MAASKEEVPSDSFAKRYRHSDFLYSRNDQYKIVDLCFFSKKYVEKNLLIDLLKFDYRKVKLNDKYEIYYDDGPCEIYIKNVPAHIIKGHHLKRNIYLQIMSISLSDFIWKMFATTMNLTNEKTKNRTFLLI